MNEATTLYLNRAAVEQVALPMSRIIAVVEQALVEKAHGRVQMPPKHWLEDGDKRWFGGMSSIVPSLGFGAMKWQSGSAENAGRGLPYITGMLFLNRLDDGVVAAVMDSTWITQQRTAAASAVTVRQLANEGSDRFAILGCGVQAYSHFEAFQQVIPGLREVIGYDIRPEAAEAFARHVESAGFTATIASSARDAVASSDIVVSAGPISPKSERPILREWLRPGLLGITLDYDCYWSSSALAAVDLVVTDDIAQVIHLRPDGYFRDCPDPAAEVGAIVAGLHPGRAADSDIIVSVNMGVAVEDVATAKEIYELARANSIGVELPL